MNAQVEIQIESDSGVSIDPTTSETAEWEGLRVRFRYDGTRRWQKFLVTRSPGQSLLELLTVAIAVVSLDESRPGGTTQPARVAASGSAVTA